MDNKTFYAQIVGVVVILLGMFGVDVDPETQTQIVGGLSAFGLVFTAILLKVDERRSKKRKKNYHVMGDD